MTLAERLALAYIQNGSQKTSEMSVEEFVKAFIDIRNQIQVCLEKSNGSDMSWAVQS